jgi:hypothetical protein
MNLHSAMTFPCNADKSPISRRGFKDAMRGVEWRKAPLVGVPTGDVNGISVLDIDPDGLGWYAAKFGALPTTRRHETPRGVHLLFSHAEGLRCSTGRIVPGVHVRAEGGYVIWWPRQGLAVDDWPIADWPQWLLEEAKGAQRPVRYRHSISVLGMGGVVDGILGELDPTQFRDHDRWLKLMMSCHAAGIDRETFIRWSTADPEYSGDGEIIRRRWDSLRADGGVSAAILLTEVRRARRAKTKIEVAVPYPASGISQPTRNWRARIDAILRVLERDQTERMLFSVTCVVAEVIGEVGKPKSAVGQQLLEGACPKLIPLIGIAEVRRSINNAFAHVANKLKEPQS